MPEYGLLCLITQEIRNEAFSRTQIWSKAHALTMLSYRPTAAFPKEEAFGLNSQIRRCSASLGANIAEGCGRRDGADLNRFLQIAMGSASELEYHSLLANDLGYLSEQDYKSVNDSVTELKRMLSALIIKIENELGRRQATFAISPPS